MPRRSVVIDASGKTIGPILKDQAVQEEIWLLDPRRWDQCQSLYYPTDAHNVRNVELLKYVQIIETAPTCFGLQRNHHQGNTASA